MSHSNRSSLTLAVIIDPPAVMPCALRRGCDEPGIVFEIAQIVCEKLRVDCRFVASDSNAYGHEENGTWTGVVGDVASGRVDSSLPRFTPTLQRAQVIDFTSSYFYEQFLLVTRRPTASTACERLDLIGAFDPYVWICIALVLILAPLIMSHTIMFRREFSVIEHYLIRPSNPHIPFFGRYITICTVSAVALVLTRSYTGYMFTKRLSSDYAKPFVDLETFAYCLQTQRCKLAVKTGTISYVRQFLDSNSSRSFAQLKLALDTNPLHDFPLDELMPRILGEETIYYTTLIWDTDFYYAARNNDLCDFYVISAAMLPGANTFPLAKDSRWKRELDRFASEFIEFGYVETIMNKYKVREKDRCKPRAAGMESDSFGYMFEVFIFLITGEGLALLCLLIEVRKRSGIITKR